MLRAPLSNALFDSRCVSRGRTIQVCRSRSDALAIDTRGEDTDILALVQPSFDPLQHQRDRFTDVEGSSLLIVVRKRSVEVDANPPVGHGRLLAKELVLGAL